MSVVSRGTLAQMLYRETGDNVIVRYVEAPGAGPDVGSTQQSVSPPFCRDNETVMVMIQSQASLESVTSVLSVVEDVPWEIDGFDAMSTSLAYFLVEE